MKIHMLILDGKSHKSGYVKPTKLIFEGKSALEDCILKLVEAYFGPTIKNRVEDMLRITRITEDEIPENLLSEDI
jgi:hypothetical protein